MNRYPNWVNWLVLIVIVGGCLVALPNIYGDDPAVQVARNDGQPVAASLLPELENTLDQADISYTRGEIDDDAVIIRFPDIENQLLANDFLSESLTTVSSSFNRQAPLARLNRNELNLSTPSLPRL